MGGATGSGFGNSLVRMGTRLGGQVPSQSGVPGYQAPSALAQQAEGRPAVTSYQPTIQMSPLAQQMMQRSMNVGLPALLAQQRPQMALPVYRPPALAYRPNLAAAQQNLSRVRPSVYKTDLDAARARVAELEAQLQPQDSGYYYSGGG